MHGIAPMTMPFLTGTIYSAGLQGMPELSYLSVA
jgi:hypothetical protein